MEGVEADSPVIGIILLPGVRVVGKRPAEIGHSGLPVVVHRQAEKLELFEIGDEFREAFGHVLEVVHLPAGDEVDRVELIPFGERNDVVRLGVDPVFVGVEVLEKIHIAEQVDVRRGVDVVGQKQPLLERDAIAVGRLRFGGLARRVDRGDVLGLEDIIGAQVAVAAILFPVFHPQVKPE